jgi:Zn-dependent M28 family amino/carboxypeptidase
MFAANPAPTPQQQAVMSHISADSLRGHLSFIASDLLEGRATPSRGLDIAAEYIAAQFRRAGLDPAGEQGYFQTTVVKDQPVNNVAAVLRGSDPVLRDTYVILSAHYDHVGMGGRGEDKIYNGANDDGSGTVSVIEIASALAAAPERPKRSILFLAFFGEEDDLIGSRYYAAHPLVPLNRTICDLMLEQIGRTDATNGPQVGVVYPTGYDYTDVPAILAEDAPLAGIRIGRDPANASYFNRSDNYPLARAGIPALAIYVAGDFADYHKPGDEWAKIDYKNMASVDRAIALGLLRLASDRPAPKWNTTIPAAARYAGAQSSKAAAPQP